MIDYAVQAVAYGRLYKILKKDASITDAKKASKHPKKEVTELLTFNKEPLSGKEEKIVAELHGQIESSFPDVTDTKLANLFIEGFNQGVNSISLKIAVARKGADLTQAELAEKLGCRQKDVSRWEHGTAPRTDTLYRISKVLNVSMEELL